MATFALGGCSVLSPLPSWGLVKVAGTATTVAMATLPVTAINTVHHGDAPVSTVDPFINLFSMLTRRTNKGTVLGAGETLTMEQALHAYTWAGAYSQFAETSRGTLGPGMLADIAVISADLFTLSPEEVLSARADLTLREGNVIFDRHGEAAAHAAQ